VRNIADDSFRGGHGMPRPYAEQRSLHPSAFPRGSAGVTLRRSAAADCAPGGRQRAFFPDYGAVSAVDEPRFQQNT
jgi:hypothetical protein